MLHFKANIRYLHFKSIIKDKMSQTKVSRSQIHAIKESRRIFYLDNFRYRILDFPRFHAAKRLNK